jgi:pimeloyl-ACP methyl ester carboxylesterase
MGDSQSTVVLVHGAGAGACSWDPTVKELEASDIAHIEVVLPTSDPSCEPTLTFHHDADHLRSLLDHLDGPIVLIGNSYGGVVVTEASARPSKRRPPRVPGRVHARQP